MDMQKSLDSLHSLMLEPRIIRAPYPIRQRDTGLAQMTVEAISEVYAVEGISFDTISSDRSLTAAQIGDWLTKNAKSSRGTPSDSPLFAASQITVALSWLEKGPIVEATPALLEMLENTDIDDSITAEQLRMPMPRSLYLLMPRTGEEYRLYDGTGGYFPLEGVLIRESHPIDPDTGESERWLEFVVASSTTAASKNALDDAYYYRPLSISKGAESKSILQLIADYDIELYARLGLTPPEPGSAEEKNEAVIRRVVSLASKVLLYLNIPNVRRADHQGRSDLLRTAPPKDPVKRRKYEQRIRGTFDRIVVGPTWEEAGLGRAGEGTSKRAHFRRGHFRNQAFGSGLSQRRLTWIHPTVVGAQGSDSPLPRDYALKR
ncbi:hypothetical protein [Dyella sp. RRB7]|uniref:hypothetical protein n=1 Tax=Dyella sp. RRB7 TaxID=2919502 RepID=UPI001FAA78A5|nr:hypothetical protein [Dyella sp. RRB7]